MSRNERDNDRNRNQEEGSSGSAGLWGFAAAAGAVGAASLGYYLYNRPSPSKESERPVLKKEPSPPPSPPGNSSFCIADFLESLTTSDTSDNQMEIERRGVPKIPLNPCITNMDSLLHDIYVRYVALNDADFVLHYQVFNEIFQSLHKTMKEVDPYYNKYSSRVQFAGSHYDRLRIKKPDEFDMDIIIDLPLNIRHDPANPVATDIVHEPKGSGFIQLKMGTQFKNLPKRDREEWLINRTAWEWMDESDYLLQSKFVDWFKGVVDKALNRYPKGVRGLPVFNVDGVSYSVRKSQSGPASTLYIENYDRKFKMDVDLVPALKFPEDRWPICRGYRAIPPGCSAPQKVWMVVPKPNKEAQNEHDRRRSWRIAMHDQERGIMYNNNNMKQTIRLMKKLRDSLEMHKIASYYVKTLFFWEAIERNNRAFWNTNIAELFKIMVKRLHKALVDGKIPYFWNERNNLIGNVNSSILNGYVAKLAKLIKVLDNPSEYKQVAKFLLDKNEFAEYNKNILHI